MQSKEQLLNQIEQFSITPPSEEDMRVFFLKAFEFIRDVSQNEKLDKFIDKQIAKLEDDKIDAFDVVFTFIKALFSKE